MPDLHSGWLRASAPNYNEQDMCKLRRILAVVCNFLQQDDKSTQEDLSAIGSTPHIGVIRPGTRGRNQADAEVQARLAAILGGPC